MNLLHTIRPQLDPRAEEINSLVLVVRALDETRLNDPTLSLRRFEQTLREARACHRHAERSGPGAAFGLHDLVATELDAADVLVKFGAGEGVAGLREEWDDGGAGVAADDGDVLVCGVGAFELGNEAGGADDVEGCYAEEAGGVVDAFAFEDFGCDWDGGVDLWFGC